MADVDNVPVRSAGRKSEGFGRTPTHARIGEGPQHHLAGANAPPLSEGEARLALIPRGDSEVVSLTWAVYKGHRYVSVRVWARTAAGAWIPIARKGVSIRVAEIDAVIGGLIAARELVGQPTRGAEPAGDSA